MPKTISQDDEKAYLKGQMLTVAELRERFSLAVTINNEDIMKVLVETDRPLTNKEIGKKLGTEKTSPINPRTRKLFQEKLVVRFHLGPSGCGHLLSEKGWNKYQEAKKLKKLDQLKTRK